MAANPPVVDPDAVDEDPEELLGSVTPDPWDDKTQLDWPNNPDPVEEEPEEEAPEVDDVEDDRDNVKVID